jgi:hypothetical protein
VQIACAVPVTLVDQASTVTIDPAGNAGMYDWNISGVSQLQSQWFWVRFGSVGPEQSIDTLPLVASGASDTNFDGSNETMFLHYQIAQQFDAQLTFRLGGAAPGVMRSDMTESITLRNLSSSPVELHFFQLCNLDLGGTPLDQRVQIVGGNTAQQWDTGYFASETVSTPLASHRQVDLNPVILNSLMDAAPTTLTDNIGPIGPGDLCWAFQWDVTLGALGSPTDTLLISKDKQVVPEPVSVLLLSLGGMIVLRRKRV